MPLSGQLAAANKRELRGVGVCVRDPYPYFVSFF